MGLIEQMGKDIVNAMKEKDQLKLSVLRMVKGAIQLENINNKKELNDELFIDVVSKQIKQRNESYEEFSKAGRSDLADKVASEIEILKGYLPEQLSSEELNKILDEVFAKVNPTSAKDMGIIMREVTSLVKGKADMKEVSNLIKDKLSNL
ncbi:MAG: GatB/YqeY domain-containing protein [Bacilli bacterium]|nr:GatB/YqeY domain-containing protein [Bacilli bacterium]